MQRTGKAMTRTALTYLILEDAYYTAIDLRDTVKRVRPGFLLAGIAEEASEAARMIRSEAPDFMIADTSAGDGDTAGILLAEGIGIPIIFISECARMAERARRLNMAAFILKPVTPADLQHALDCIDGTGENDERETSKHTRS